MKKIPATFFAVFMLLAFARAQQIQWTPVVTKEISPLSSIIGSDNQGYYVLRNAHRLYEPATRTTGNIIEKRSYDGKVIFSSNANYEDKDGTYFLMRVLMMDKGPVIIFFEKKTKSYYAFNVGSDGSLVNKSLLLTDNDLKAAPYDGGIMFMGRDNKEYKYAVSDDSTKLLVYHETQDKKEVVRLFGDNLKQLWSKEADFSLDKNTTVDHATADDDKAYFAVLKTSGNWPSYSMYTVGNTGPVIKTNLTPESNVSFVSAMLKVSREGDIIVGGMTQKHTFNSFHYDNGITGYCVMRVNSTTGKITQNKSTDFSKEFFSEFEEDKKVEKGIGIQNLGIEHVIEMPDKDILLLAEQMTFGSSYCHSGAGASESYQNNISMDVVLMKTKPDGSQAWVQDMPKNQGNYYEVLAQVVCSYAYLFNGDNIYLLYNGDKQVADLSAADMESQKSNLGTNVMVEPGVMH